MKYIAIALVSLLFTIQNSYSQSFSEVGVFFGGSYYNGDLNNGVHFPSTNTHLALGGLYKYNFNERWAFRIQGSRLSVSGDDALADDPFQIQRNLSFESTVYEAIGMFEFSFFEFEGFSSLRYFHKAKTFSPYLTLGLGAFYFDPYANLDGNSYQLAPLMTEDFDYARWSVAVPFGAGLKVRLFERLILSGEWVFRKTFTDYIDDVSGFYPSDPEGMTELARDLSDRSLEQVGKDGTNWGTQRGRQNTKDWYSSAGITLTVILGHNPNRCPLNQDKD